jgi:phosphatidylglycerophosphatase A
MGFALFRFFDIVKPWPIRYLDAKVPGGAGIMLDDIVAGIFSLIILHVILTLL